MSSVQAIRRAVREATDALHQSQAQPERRPEFTYVPPSHARALDLEAILVEGIRGAGKSFWWAQLASERHRSFIRRAFPEVRMPEGLQVAQGFGAGLSIAHAPDAATLASLVGRFPPRAIWRAVVARHAGFSGDFSRLRTWEERVGWIHSNPEPFAEQIEEADQKLGAGHQTLLVLFDALDRLADDWQHIRPLTKGLLQVALDIRSTRNIRCKVYLRPDILKDQDITSFPDYSKLLAGKTSLEWRRADLYALLFQCIGNATSGGEEFRTWEKMTPSSVWKRHADVWNLPAVLRSDEKLQEQLFEALAGEAMGSSKKRGKPYKWLVNHLQDGQNQVSPRSFFAALRKAAIETGEEFELPLDYRGIQKGVQDASAIRVQEIAEDYPWVQVVMEPLRGRLRVPCDGDDFEAIWKEEGTVALLAKRLQEPSSSVKLPPQNLEQGTAGLLLDLEALGMVQRLDSRRIQMPDVYRIAYGLGRLGGVKPLR